MTPEIKSIIKVIKSGKFILGHELEVLEKTVARIHQCKYAIGVNSGTDALTIAIRALNLRQSDSDEIITTPYTFISTSSAIVQNGMIPRFVDIGEDKLIDSSKIELAIEADPRYKVTKAILPVHLFGRRCDMRKIMSLARKYHLKVIEDLCQAFGTPLTGDIGCLSFYPTKSLGAYGDAGMILTNSDKLNVKCRILRNNGSSLEEKYRHIEVGFNSRLDEIQAAILNIRIKDKKRIKNFKYNESKYYPLPLHLQPCFKYLGYHKGDFPQSEKFAQEVREVKNV